MYREGIKKRKWKFFMTFAARRWTQSTPPPHLLLMALFPSIFSFAIESYIYETDFTWSQSKISFLSPLIIGSKLTFAFAWNCRGLSGSKTSFVLMRLNRWYQMVSDFQDIFLGEIVDMYMENRQIMLKTLLIQGFIFYVWIIFLREIVEV